MVVGIHFFAEFCKNSLESKENKTWARKDPTIEQSSQSKSGISPQAQVAPTFGLESDCCSDQLNDAILLMCLLASIFVVIKLFLTGKKKIYKVGPTI